MKRRSFLQFIGLAPAAAVAPAAVKAAEKIAEAMPDHGAVLFTDAGTSRNYSDEADWVTVSSIYTVNDIFKEPWNRNESK